MKIAVIGPGAIGTFITALIGKSDNDVFLIDKDPGRAALISESGLKVEGKTRSSLKKIKVTAESASVGEADIVILAVKSFDTESAVKMNASLIGSKTAVLTLQNGLGNIQTLKELLPEDSIVAGTTSMGVTLLSPGHVFHAGEGQTVIGRPDKRLTGQLKKISNLFTESGIPTRISKDIRGVIWSKLLVNVGINALTALLGVKNGKILDCEDARSIMKQAIVEGFKVSKRKRVKLVYEDPVQQAELVCRSTADNYSSMCQDLTHGKRTEVDFINGAVVRLAKNYNISTPVNETLTGLIKCREALLS